MNTQYATSKIKFEPKYTGVIKGLTHSPKIIAPKSQISIIFYLLNLFLALT